LLSGLALALLLSSPARGEITVRGNRVHVDTSRYTAEFAGAAITSFRNKLVGGAEMVSAPEKPSPLLLLVMGSPSINGVLKTRTDTHSVVMDGASALVTYRWEVPKATYTLRIAVNPETEDLVLTVHVSTPEPLYQRNWYLYPGRAGGRLLLPMWGGTCLPSRIPRGMHHIWGRTDNFIDVPAIVYERNDHAGGFAFWVHSGDTRVPFSFQVHDDDGKRTVRTTQTDWIRPVRDEAGLEFRLNTYKGNWSYGVDLLRHRAFPRIDNEPPAWLGDVRLVYNTPHLREPRAILTVADITDVMDRANQTFPHARPLKPNNVLLYHNDWSADGHDRNYPEYAMNPLPGHEDPTPYKVFTAEAKKAGYRIMPHFNAKEVARFKTDQGDPSRILGDHPVWQAYRDYIVEEWDNPRKKHVQKGWKTSGEPAAHTMYAVGLGNESYRHLLRDRMLAVADEVKADAVFLDTSKGAWSPADINPNNAPGSGSNYQGLKALIDDLRVSGRAVGGEMPCWETIKAGQQLSQVFSVGAPQFDDYYRYMHAISGCLLSDSQLFFGHLAMPSPDADPVNYFRQYIGCFFQGALQNVRWPAPPWAASRESAYDKRGKVWANEGALYALNHGVKLFTGPSKIWSDDNVLIIEVVDGVNVPRTEEWLVKTLIADWHWIYGGRAPTKKEFEAAVAGKHLRDGSLIAQLETMISDFRRNPTPPDEAEPRGLALTKIYELFPGYPLVDKTVWWKDAAGEQLVTLSPTAAAR